MDTVHPASDEPEEPGPRRSTFTPAPADAYQAVFGQTGRSPVPLNAPPPNPSTAVIPPPGSELPSPPQRKSLPDSDLLSALGHQDRREVSALEALEQVQHQLHIREQEAREFRNWETSMRAIGTPEALEVVEEVRTTFTEAIQVIPPFENTETDVESPVQVASAPPEPAASVDPEELVHDLVEPEVPARSHSEALNSPSVEEPDDASTATEAEIPEPDTGDSAPTEHPPSVPVDEAPDVQLAAQRVFTPETAGPEPTAEEHRNGRAFRLFWLWFAVNSSVLSVVLGAVLLGMGMSLRQAVLATLAGVALSFLPTGLATLASKWNGQPTMVVSRASFGHAGNVVPAALAVITRVLWGAALLWFLGVVGSALLAGAGVGGALSRNQLGIVVVGIGFLLAVVIAFFGYRLIAWTQLVLSVASAVLIVGVIAVTWPLVDMTSALSIPDGPWVLVLTGAILVFSYVGLSWASGAGDIARYQRPTGSGASSMLTASFGSALPPFVLVAYGALLAASNPDLAAGFLTDPVATLAAAGPSWFLLPLLAAAGVGLLSAVILSVYSGGFATQALGLRMRRDVSVLALGVITGTVAIALTASGLDLDDIFRDLATTLAVPAAAWLGIFAAEMMIRTSQFDAGSLLQARGVYPRVRWVNLAMLVVAAVLGYGLTTASVAWLSWQGYLIELVGIPLGSELAESDLGVIVALLIALITPLVAGIPEIRRQESPRPASVEFSAGVPREQPTPHR